MLDYLHINNIYLEYINYANIITGTFDYLTDSEGVYVFQYYFLRTIVSLYN